MTKHVFRAQGMNGSLELDDEIIKIVRKGFSAFLNHGLKGDKQIRVSMISSIQFKEAGRLSNGYIQFTFSGGREAKGGLFEAASDENTVIFKATQQPSFVKLKNQLDQLILSKNGGVSNPTGSAAEEVSKLAELKNKGILSNLEFDKKKEELLGLANTIDVDTADIGGNGEIEKDRSAVEQDISNQRKVGILLGVSIVLIPFIFAWLTLRKGYSSMARVLAFVWLVIFAVMVSDTPQNSSNPLSVDDISITEDKEGVSGVVKKAKSCDVKLNLVDAGALGSDELIRRLKKEIGRGCTDTSLRWSYEFKTGQRTYLVLLNTLDGVLVRASIGILCSRSLCLESWKGFTLGQFMALGDEITLPNYLTDDSVDSDTFSPTMRARLQDFEKTNCRNSLQCWGDRHGVVAALYCDEHIERLTNYNHKWTDGILGSKFSRFSWKDKKKGLLTFYGDSIQFQNGFGAWQNYIYECDIDPINETVLDVRASPGRM